MYKYDAPKREKRKRIILVTLFDENNIGNRLQNYALQQILIKYQADVTVIDNGYTTRPSLGDILKAYIKGLLGIFGNQYYRKRFREFIFDNKKRKANEKFDQRNIRNIIKVNNKKAFRMNWDQYDMAIAGSDQVWHKWRNDENELPFYYLEFMPKEKRFSYAASFGFESIPYEDIVQHRRGISGMNKISCREEMGCKIVSDITKRYVPRVLDPTLLLSVSEWEEIYLQAPK